MREKNSAAVLVRSCHGGRARCSGPRCQQSPSYGTRGRLERRQGSSRSRSPRPATRCDDGPSANMICSVCPDMSLMLVDAWWTC